VSDPFFEADPQRMPLEKLLPWVGSAVAQHHQRAVAAHGLSPTALGALGILGHCDGLSHRELAAGLHLAPATLTPVLDALEAAGEVRRERDRADRRVVRLSITDRGRVRLKETFAQVRSMMQDRMPRLSTPEEVVVRRYLVAVLAAVSEDATDG
jgi:DNA-binding MarR family transcriptional regulator